MTPTSRQSTLFGAFSKPQTPSKPTKAQQEEFYKVLAWACAVDLRPMSMVTGLGFRTMCEVINPTMNVPSRTTLTKYVGVLYDQV